MMASLELKCSDFGDNLASVFRDLRRENDLVDITLVCADGQLKAHKVVLAASSDFFKSIIKRNPHPHPLIYFKDVRTDDLNSLLDYIYLGKAKVPEDKVQHFLALGEELGIKGIEGNKQVGNARNVENSKNERNDEHLLQTYTNLWERAKTGTRFDNQDFKTGDYDYKDELNITVEMENDESFNASINADVDAQIENLLTKIKSEDGELSYQCNECNKYSKKKNNMKKHIEIHLEGLSFSCKVCKSAYKTRNMLQKHMYKTEKCKPKRHSKQ